MAEASVVITREELYRRVWQVPLKQLVEEFDTTYHDLRRIALMLDVPRPPRGYWNKLAAGNASDPPPLPDLVSGQPRSCLVRRIGQEQQQQAERIEEYKASLGTISVPKALLRPHPLIAGWMKERSAHERRSVRQNTLAASFFEPSETDGRRHRILQALLPALEKQGAQIMGEHDEGEIEARFAGAAIKFRLREKLRQVRRALTKKEQSQAWNALSSYHIELHPTGVLSFRIETYTKVGFRTWEDTDKCRLEDRLTEIAATILMARQGLVEEMCEAQRRQVLAQQEKVQRRVVEERQRLEEARWTGFVSLSRRSDEAAHLRSFLNRLEAAGLRLHERYGDRTAAEWLAWARERIDRIDPFSSGAASVIERLVRVV